MSQIISNLRIQKILTHFEFLQAKLNENLKNDDLIKFSKEYAELKPIYEHIQKFNKTKKELSEAKELFHDPEFKDLASIEELIRESEKLPIIKNSSKHVIVASRSHMSKETKDFVDRRREIKENIEIVSIGSSLKICMVAEGKADVYPRLAPTMEWDVAAGHSIAKYSGFKILNYDNGTELTYNKENLLNPFFVVE